MGARGFDPFDKMRMCTGQFTVSVCLGHQSLTNKMGVSQNGGAFLDLRQREPERCVSMAASSGRQ